MNTRFGALRLSVTDKYQNITWPLGSTPTRVCNVTGIKEIFLLCNFSILIDSKAVNNPQCTGWLNNMTVEFNCHRSFVLVT